MADGHHPTIQNTLAAATADGGRLLARCACGAEAAIDPAPWLREGLAAQPLWSLEDRLRCLCGARSARLIAAEPHTALAAGVAIYRFR